MMDGILRTGLRVAPFRELTQDGYSAPMSELSSSPLSPPAAALNHRELLFHVRDLGRIYGEGTATVTALASVDLDLYAGELIVLLGASGSGKSTLLNQLGGLDSPTHGTLHYRGADLAAFDETALTRAENTIHH